MALLQNISVANEILDELVHQAYSEHTDRAEDYTNCSTLQTAVCVLNFVGVSSYCGGLRHATADNQENRVRIQ